MNVTYYASLINSILRMTTPILFATLGCLICSKVNVFNIALEGQMLIASFTSIVVNHYTHNVYLCVLSGALSGALIGWIVAIFQVKLKAKDMVVGVSINLFITSITSYLMYVMFGLRGTLREPDMVSLTKLSIPFPENMAFLNRTFENLTILDFAAYVFAILIFIFLFKTVAGFHVMSVGINKTATVSLGTKADRIQIWTIVISGALCGLGGVSLSMGSVTMFTEAMTSGRGYMAMVASSLVGAHPLGAIAASLFFGTAVASTKALQNYINGQITVAFPYIATLLIMCINGYVVNKRNIKLKGNKIEND